MVKFKAKLRKVKQTKRDARYDTSSISDKYKNNISNRFRALEVQGRDPEEIWVDMKKIIHEEAKANIPTKKQPKKAHWLSQKSVDIAKRRRSAKSEGKRDKARELNAQFQKQARKDKTQYIEDICINIQQHSETNSSKQLFHQIKEITGTFKARKCNVKDSLGNLLTDPQGIIQRWKEYVENLYKKDTKINAEFLEINYDNEPEILEKEVEQALTNIARNKSPGSDNIPIELLNQPDKDVIKTLTALCNRIWKTAKWPEDWKHSIYIPLPKKGDITLCSNNRTISLISHCSKIMLKIIQRRLEPYLERELRKEQAGFRKGRGCRDHISNLRRIMETTREFQHNVIICFIDYSKAFDCVDHKTLWNTLRDMGIPEHLIVLLNNLYNEQQASVRTEFGDSEHLKIEKGVRQGCILSPYLFNLYAERIMREIDLEQYANGVKLGGLNITNLRYADDTTLLATTIKDMKEMLTNLKKASMKAGLSLNIKKTKVMFMGESEKLTIDGEEIEKVEKMVFLGAEINRTATSSADIKRRIALGRTAVAKLATVWKDNHINQKTKIKLLETLVFSIVLYGSESWVINKIERKRIDSFELWCYRRVLRIPWTKRSRNAEVVNIINPKMTLEGRILFLKLKYVGHSLRREDSLEKFILLGNTSGTRRRGRQRTRWWDKIIEETGMKLVDMNRKAQDRTEWRRFCYQAARSRKRLDGTG